MHNKKILISQPREKILDALLNNDGLTITGISNVLSIHPSTASKYLAVMEAEGSITCRSIGMAKVFRVMK